MIEGFWLCLKGLFFTTEVTEVHRERLATDLRFAQIKTPVHLCDLCGSKIFIKRDINDA